MSRSEVAVPLAFVGLGVTIVTALVFLVTPMIGKGLPSLDVRLPEIGREAPAQRIEPGPPAQFDPAGSGDPACPVVEGRPGALADDSLALDLPPGWLESSVGHAWLECGQSVESSSGDAVESLSRA